MNSLTLAGSFEIEPAMVRDSETTTCKTEHDEISKERGLVRDAETTTCKTEHDEISKERGLMVSQID